MSIKVLNYDILKTTPQAPRCHHFLSFKISSDLRYGFGCNEYFLSFLWILASLKFKCITTQSKMNATGKKKIHFEKQFYNTTASFVFPSVLSYMP